MLTFRGKKEYEVDYGLIRNTRVVTFTQCTFGVDDLNRLAFELRHRIEPLELYFLDCEWEHEEAGFESLAFLDKCLVSLEIVNVGNEGITSSWATFLWRIPCMPHLRRLRIVNRSVSKRLLEEYSKNVETVLTE